MASVPTDARPAKGTVVTTENPDAEVASPDASMLEIVGGAPFAPPLPRPVPFGVVVPAPRSHAPGGAVVVRHDFVSVADTGPAGDGALHLLREGMFRVGVPVSSEAGGYPVRLLAGAVPGGEEAYRLSVDSEGATLTANGAVGLVRGAATLRQLIRRAPDGIEIATGEILDAPTVPLRILGGWGLYRTEQYETALQIAVEGKLNRVLYNWWSITPEETMGPAEDRFVCEARALGIEPILELRRQSFGSRLFDDPQGTAALLARFDEALDHGFTCFSLLFDDTDVDAFEDEHRLVAHVREHISERLGHSPELYYCPRFYWLPGEMDYSWIAAALAEADVDENLGLRTLAEILGDATPRSPAAATARQEQFQTLLAQRVPGDVNLYLANWFSAVPHDWAEQLERGWTGRLGRPPVFWDNQQQNDFRAALGYPFPLHQRPAEFAETIRGYYVNSGVPLALGASASITAGAWAWNPHGYDPATSFGAATNRVFGSAGGAATDALASYAALVDELMDPRTGLETHYAGLRRAVNEGRTESVRTQLTAIHQRIASVDGELDPRTPPFARSALAELRQDLDRIRLDLELTELVDGGDSHGGPDAVLDEALRLVARIGEILLARLPRHDRLSDLLAPDVETSAIDTTTIAGFPWLNHFYLVPRSRTLDPLLRELRARLHGVAK